jgi:hypothetical protein
MLYALFYTILVLAWLLDLTNVIDLPLFSLLTIYNFPIGNVIYFALLVLLPAPDTIKKRRSEQDE